MKTEPLSTDPLHFWRMLMKDTVPVFPTVAVGLQAKNYCPCQQRQYSVPCERLFSAGGILVNK